MFHFSPTAIVAVLQQWGYLGIFLCVLVGNIGVPVPEESVVLAAGFLAGREILDLRLVILIALSSAVIGDNLGYLIGRTGGHQVLMNLLWGWRGPRRRYGRFRTFFRAHGGKAVLVARFVAGLRFMAGPMAGAARLPFWRFFFFNVSGAVLWCTSVSLLGFVLGDHWEQVALAARHTSRWLFAALAIAALLTLITNRLAQRPIWMRARASSPRPIKPASDVGSD